MSETTIRYLCLVYYRERNCTIYIFNGYPQKWKHWPVFITHYVDPFFFNNNEHFCFPVVKIVTATIQ